MNLKITLVAWVLCGLLSTVVEAQTAQKTKAVVAAKSVAPAPKTTLAKNSTATRAPASRAPSSTSSPVAAKNDPNHAVEIRGQSRTLSMMLVLKNGKENINFIKIRKDYNPEISGTQY